MFLYTWTRKGMVRDDDEGSYLYAPDVAPVLRELLEFAIEANNRLPSPATPEEFRAGFGCNQYAVEPFKLAAALLEKCGG